MCCNFQVPVSEVRELVGPLAKKAEWSKALARAVEDLESVADNAKALGLEVSMRIRTLKLWLYVMCHDGYIWRINGFCDSEIFRLYEGLKLSSVYCGQITWFLVY